MIDAAVTTIDNRSRIVLPGGDLLQSFNRGYLLKFPIDIDKTRKCLPVGGMKIKETGQEG